jgi:hypothetical protein
VVALITFAIVAFVAAAAATTTAAAETAVSVVLAYISVTIGPINTDVAFRVARETRVHLKRELVNDKIRSDNLRVVATVPRSSTVGALQGLHDAVVQVKEQIPGGIPDVHV